MNSDRAANRIPLYAAMTVIAILLYLGTGIEPQVDVSFVTMHTRTVWYLSFFHFPLLRVRTDPPEPTEISELLSTLGLLGEEAELADQWIRISSDMRFVITLKRVGGTRFFLDDRLLIAWTKRHPELREFYWRRLRQKLIEDFKSPVAFNWIVKVWDAPEELDEFVSWMAAFEK